MMSAPSTTLPPPLDTPIPRAQLSEHTGADPAKPILVAIKGTVFDVTAKREMYGPGGSYSVFAGKDGSKGLGMSSLKPEVRALSFVCAGPGALESEDARLTFDFAPAPDRTPSPTTLASTTSRPRWVLRSSLPCAYAED